jgi:hypothetical protein
VTPVFVAAVPRPAGACCAAPLRPPHCTALPRSAKQTTTKRKRNTHTHTDGQGTHNASGTQAPRTRDRSQGPLPHLPVPPCVAHWGSCPQGTAVARRAPRIHGGDGAGEGSTTSAAQWEDDPASCLATVPPCRGARVPPTGPLPVAFPSPHPVLRCPAEHRAASVAAPLSLRRIPPTGTGEGKQQGKREGGLASERTSLRVHRAHLKAARERAQAAERRDPRTPLPALHRQSHPPCIFPFTLSRRSASFHFPPSPSFRPPPPSPSPLVSP